MRILILNPNTSEIFTSNIQAAADKYKSPGTEVVAKSPRQGPRSIESAYDELLSSPPSLELFIMHEADFDGFLIACYGDHPVIHAGREITKKPVMGIMEATVYSACLLGRRFSVVGDGDRSGDPGFWETVRRYGVADRCASVRRPGLATLEMEASGDQRVRKLILDEARKAIEEDGAEVICLGCAGMVGLDKEIQKQLGVPVLDGVVLGMKLIEALVGYGVGTSKKGGYGYPPGKELLDLPPVFELPYSRKS